MSYLKQTDPTPQHGSDNLKTRYFLFKSQKHHKNPGFDYIFTFLPRPNGWKMQDLILKATDYKTIKWPMLKLRQ